MPPKKKPKKLFIQIAIAAVIAIVVGVGAIGAVISVITSVQSSSAKEAQDAAAKARKAQEELAAIKASQKQVVKTDYYQVQAISNIEPGEPITQGEVKEVTVETQPDASVINHVADVIGHVATLPILEGETLSKNKIMANTGFIQIKPGMRAMSIDVDPVGSVSGALFPGSYVDVLYTAKFDGQNSGGKAVSLSKTLLQNVQIVAVNGSATSNGPGGNGASISGITLAVTPQQAELLALAQQQGKFALTLRNFKDKDQNKLTGADMDYLITGISPPANIPRFSDKTAGGGQGGYNPANPEAGMHNVSNTPGGLPEPGGSLPPEKPKYSMQIYKGSGSETVNFQ